MDLYEFEAVLEGGADAGADPGETSGVVDPGTPDTTAVEAVVEPEATPTWAPTQEDWSSLTQRLDALSQAVAPPPPAAPAAPQLADYLQTDPTTGEQSFTPEGLERYINDRVNDRLSTVEPVLNQTIADRGEQLIQQRLGELQTEVGPFDAKLARQVAEGLASLPGADPNVVLKQAAEYVREAQKAAADAAVEEYKKTLSNVGGAAREPGASGAAVDRVEPLSGPVGYKDVERSFLERYGIAVS